MSHRGTEKQFHGKLAANGEVFDMTANTAAHRKLPLGSIVRVRNLGMARMCKTVSPIVVPMSWGACWTSRTRRPEHWAWSIRARRPSSLK